jgi:hypothetical protein
MLKETLGILWFSETITVIPFGSLKTLESLMLIMGALPGFGITDLSI